MSLFAKKDYKQSGKQEEAINNYKQALKYYEKLYQLFQKASQEDAEAQKELAKKYLVGKPFVKDEKKYIYWIKKSAENGNAEAQSMLSINYFKGTIIEKDLVKFVSYCYQAARQGNVDAMGNLAFIYNMGIVVNKNIERAIYWNKKAAQMGSETAQNNLEKLYYYDKIIQDAIQKNYAVKTYQGESDEVIEKIPHLLEQAEEGEFSAQCELVRLYGKADDMQNLEELRNVIMENLQKKAEQGDIKAELDLAGIYQYGWYGLDKNYDVAIMWYKRAAESGQVEAMKNLSHIYCFNYCFNEKDEKELNKWANKALNKYMELWNAGEAEAAENIGDIYRYYLNDESKAIEWYNKAVAQGHLKANAKLGYIYERTEDYVKAIEYYKKAVDAEEYSYCENLAKIYIEEMNDKKNALKYSKILIENAQYDYQFFMGCYFLSEIVPQSERAYWLLKCADSGDFRASRKRLQAYVERMKNNIAVDEK